MAELLEGRQQRIGIDVGWDSGWTGWLGCLKGGRTRGSLEARCTTVDTLQRLSVNGRANNFAPSLFP